MALERAAARPVLFDGAQLAEQSGTFLNAIIAGVMAGSDVLGIEKQKFIEAIEAEGKAVAANLKGFELGYAISREKQPTVSADGNLGSAGPATDPRLDMFPVGARAIIGEGLNRTTDYQSATYGARYLQRLKPFADRSADLVEAIARHLAVRMTYDDIVRVAQVKIRQGRFDRIRGEAKAATGDAVHVTDFFKPGIPEIADLLPPGWARRLLNWAAKKDRMTRLSWPMHVQTTTVGGFLKVWLLAKLRGWRPRSVRWRNEQAEIDAWLELIQQAAKMGDEAAHAVADLSRLIKGYGSTHNRGAGNYRRIVEELVAPVLAGRTASGEDFAGQIVAASVAALSDPSGAALADSIAAAATGSSPTHVRAAAD